MNLNQGSNLALEKRSTTSNQAAGKTDPSQQGDDWKKLLKVLASLFSALYSCQKSQNLVDDVEFWGSLEKVNHAGFADSSSIQKLVDNRPGYIESLVRSKGLEQDWARKINNDLLNPTKVAELAENPIDPVGDVYVGDIFAVERQPVQMKTTRRIPNDPGRTMRNARKHLRDIPRKYPKGTRIVANQPVLDAAERSRSYDHKAYPIERGWSDKEEARFINSKLDKAKKGKASPDLTAKVVISTIAKVALVGAGLLALVKVITDWRYWRDGEISGEEFIKRILKQAGIGALIGGGAGALYFLLFSEQ